MIVMAAKNLKLKIEDRKYWEERAWKEFLIDAGKNKSAKQLIEFFDNLLSDDEKKTIMKRLAVFSMIRAGKSYKEISEILWVSPKIVSAMKKSIIGKEGYKSTYYYNEANKKEKLKKIKPLPEKTIFDYWANFPWPSYGKGRWKYLDYHG